MDVEFFSLLHDHILVYAKDRARIKLNRTRTEGNNIPEHYDKVDEKGRRYYLKPLRAMSSRDDTREAKLGHVCTTRFMRQMDLWYFLRRQTDLMVDGGGDVRNMKPNESESNG